MSRFDVAAEFGQDVDDVLAWEPHDAFHIAIVWEPRIQRQIWAPGPAVGAIHSQPVSDSEVHSSQIRGRRDGENGRRYGAPVLGVTKGEADRLVAGPVGDGCSSSVLFDVSGCQVPGHLACQGVDAPTLGLDLLLKGGCLDLGVLDDSVDLDLDRADEHVGANDPQGTQDGADADGQEERQPRCPATVPPRRGRGRPR